MLPQSLLAPPVALLMPSSPPWLHLPPCQTVERLQLLFGAEVVHMRNEKALGYGQANTKGIEAARGEYVALINNDMFVVKGWLTAILETFRLRPKAGMVGPLFLGRNNIVQVGRWLVEAAHL